MKKVLSQDEIDAVFQGNANSAARDAAQDISAFNLSQLDRIPKTQLRAIHLVHENFVRNLASTLSAYLRSDVGLNLVSLEQISYSEFIDGLSFPTCMAYVSMAPFEGTAVLEMGLTLMFSLLELLMGSKPGNSLAVQRKITDIEKSIMQTLLRVILRDLKEAWSSVAAVNFAVQSLASEPQLMQVLAPTEAVIVIAVDVRIGAASGLMNFAIPSIFTKRLRHKFEQLQSVRKPHLNDTDQSRVARLMQDVELNFAAILEGGAIPARALVDLEPGHVLVFDYPVNQPIKATLNDSEKWSGTMAIQNNKLAFRALAPVEPKI